MVYRLIILFTLGVFLDTPVVFQTTDMLQANGAHLGKGSYVRVMGKSEIDDGGQGLYKITSGIANGYDKLSITGSSLIAQLVVNNQVNAISYGFKNDVILVDSISISTAGVLTVPTSVFSLSDVGKKIYIRNCYDMRGKYEAYSGYQGIVANYSALPASPLNKHIYQVTNAGDDPLRDTLTGTQYYFYYTTEAAWVWLDAHQAVLAEITSYSSPTSVTIDYSRPIDNATGLSGYFGTNNRTTWDSLSQFIVANELEAYFPSGSGYLVNTEFDNPYDTLNLTKDFHSFGLSGDGQGLSKIYLTHLPDTGVVTTDFLDPLNNPEHNTFIRVFENAGDNKKAHFRVHDLSFIGVDDVGYRRNDSWPDFSFMSWQNVGGNINFESSEWLGGSNVAYYNNSASKLEATYESCYVDGGDNGIEIMFTWYGANESDLLFLRETTFKNIGQPAEWSFNAKARGISIYNRPWRSYKVIACIFENIFDRWQDYDGGGVDIVHSFKTGLQLFRDCQFIANGKRILVGFWSSRTSIIPQIWNCHFKGINGGEIATAINARNSIKISGCHFGPGVIVPISTLSNNNVWDNETFIDVDKCVFQSGRIDIYSNSLPVAPVNINIRNSEFPFDNGGSSERIRLLGGSNTSKVLLENCTFKDTANTSVAVFFWEGNGDNQVLAKDCFFGYNNGTNQVQIAQSLRGNATLTLQNCEVPDTITALFDISAYTGEVGPKLLGTGNQMNYSITNASGNPGQAFECYRYGSHSGTTDLNGEISVTLDKACNFDFANIQIIGDNAFHADVISIDSSALNVRIKDAAGLDVPSTAVNFNYTINKAP